MTLAGFSGAQSTVNSDNSMFIGFRTPLRVSGARRVEWQKDKKRK